MKNNIKLLDKIIQKDPYLEPYQKIIGRRLKKIDAKKKQLTRKKISLADFASGHEYFGLHFRRNRWILREWAPNATAIYMIGDRTGWLPHESYRLERSDQPGDWAMELPAEKLAHGDLYRLLIKWPDGEGDRIPSYARRVVQDPVTKIFNAQVWHPEPYQWKINEFHPPQEPIMVYEAHIGMAQDAEKIGTYREFTTRILPRIMASGYNTIQLMAIQEHPYYGSFGYQVSSYFAASSRFGTPEDLKALIDTAHSAGLRVTVDLIHSHSVSNEVEGLSRFDGTDYQYFHSGDRGRHEAWDSRCFDYGKIEVLHFLLSNCRYWLDEFRFDGFRFDGITSMLYHHHGLGTAFTSYDDYFNDTVDEDALTYLALANQVVHEIRPEAVTVAEDISGMPGLAVSGDNGGIGFDYRFAMGVPDYWIRLIKEYKDEDWPMGGLWHELNNRRADEKIISYAESHDQALVGDKSIIFRLIDSDMYHHMQIHDDNLTVERGLSLQKMIRMITLATAGHGYLNFMGNEFGHPEWIDFPRQENNWSYFYARRQWHLVDDPNLKYHYLAKFDRDMILLSRKTRLLEDSTPTLLLEHNDDNILIFMRKKILFAFNFHPHHSYNHYRFQVPAGQYRLIMDSDAPEYGGSGRLVAEQTHYTLDDSDKQGNQQMLSLYLPSRTVQVFSFSRA